MSEETSVQVILDNDAVFLRYYPRSKIVHHEIRRFVYGEPFRDLLERGLEVFIKNGACKWLSDDRANSAIRPADAEWAMVHWRPRVMAAGWKYWAVVLPEKVFGQMNMKRWIKTYEDQGISVGVFTDPEAAMQWLAAQ